MLMKILLKSLIGAKSPDFKLFEFFGYFRKIGNNIDIEFILKLAKLREMPVIMRKWEIIRKILRQSMEILAVVSMYQEILEI